MTFLSYSDEFQTIKVLGVEFLVCKKEYEDRRQRRKILREIFDVVLDRLAPKVKEIEDSDES